ncbi:acyltransferase [Celeribacter sp. HF31]|nr:acyltransferase [Celeribacter sp. HF31]
MILNSFQYLRGIAILIIVIAHMVPRVYPRSFSVEESAAYNLFQGGTTPFVFLSGFILIHVFLPRFASGRLSYGAFMRDKIENIWLPYLILALPFLLLTASQNNLVTSYLGHAFGTGDFVQNTKDTLWLLYTGRHVFAHWYVTFAIFLFALTPLYVVYSRARPTVRALILGLAFIMSLCLHKPMWDVSKLHALLYFSSVYMIGIETALNWDRIAPRLQRNVWTLFVLWLMLIGLQMSFGYHGTQFRTLSLSYAGPDLMLLQKLVLTFALLALFERLKHKNLPVLTSLAENSFGIFLLHPIVYYILMQSGLLPRSGVLALDVTIWATMVMTGCYAAIATAKLSFPKYSRKIVGV